MTKQLTPLEALENIRKLFIGSPIDLSQQLDIIETALKDYEKQKQLVQTLQDKIYVKEIKYAKQEKALEIIKTKRVDVNDLLLFADLKCYNEYVIACDDNKKRVLTKQEYDLLKEELFESEAIHNAN